MDLFVISIAIIFEVFVNIDSVGLIVFMLFWRVIRIVHGFFTSFEIEHKRTSIHNGTGNHDAITKEIDELRRRIAELEGTREASNLL